MVKLTPDQSDNFQFFLFGFLGFLFSNLLYDFIKTFLHEYIKLDKNNIRDQFFVIFMIFLFILYFLFSIPKIR